MSPFGPAVRAGLLVVAWFAWMMAFLVLRPRRGEKAVRMDPRARWGILLEMAAFFTVHTHSSAVWASNLAVWRAVAGSLFAGVAIALAWNAVGSLGRQWRIDAGLNQDHELVQRGAYRIVRHPIYASMLAMLLAVVCWVGTLPGWPFALVVFFAGTEVRIRVEDNLLQSRFGDRFLEWQRAMPAYIPFLR